MKKMGYKAPSDIYWTILELKGLLEDDESCVYFERHKKHIGMHPFHMQNINSSLREILNSKLNAYDAELDELLLAYKNPTLLTPYAGILHDTCYIHMDIEADFYIFRPKVGTKLKGLVNKVGLNHIGVLVHKVFIASIPQPEEEEDWPGNNVNMGQEIKFTVNQVDFSSKLPYIRGVLHEDEYLEGCKLYNNEITEEYDETIETENSNTKNNSFHEDFVADSSGISARKRKRITFDSDTEDDEEETGGKKLKKMKLKTEKSKNPPTDGNSTLDTEYDQEIEEHTPKLKKHKKIRSEIKEEKEEKNTKRNKNSSFDGNSTQETENDQETEEQTRKLKKHKKIRSEIKNENGKKNLSFDGNSTQDTENDQETEQQTPKLKKHKKIHSEIKKEKEEKTAKINKNSPINGNSTQNIENSSEIEDQKAKIKKHKIFELDKEKEKKKNVKSKSKHSSFDGNLTQDTENDNEFEDEESTINKTPKKIKKSKKKIKIEHASDEIESVVKKIKTEPCDESVKVKKEPSKSLKCKIQKQEDSD